VNPSLTKRFTPSGESATLFSFSNVSVGTPIEVSVIYFPNPDENILHKLGWKKFGFII
jgi:hypothetical protein